jgi:hypothetical protein
MMVARGGEDNPMRVFWRAVSAIAATGISVVLSMGLVSPSLASTGAGPAATATAATARSAVAYYSAAGALNGVAAASNNDAWAVGYAGASASAKVLMLHWNGSQWSRVTSPGVLAATGELKAITVVSAKDVWAVGDVPASGGGLSQSLLLHWNGAAWSEVTSPGRIAGGLLWGVTATATSGWAVGYVNTDPSAPLCCAGAPLILRWNGATWSRVSAAPLGNGAYLKGAAVTTAGRTWAIGGPLAQITGALATWNGSAWSWVKSFPVQGAFRPLEGIAAGPGGTAFAVGTDNSATPAPISMRWTGSAWQKVTVSASAGSSLNAVAFAPGGTAWAAGVTGLGPVHPLIMRWSGSAWARVAAPGSGEGINGLAFSGAGGYGWAVGQTFSTSGSTTTVILHWTGTAWTAAPAAPPAPPTRYATAGGLAGVAAASAASAWAVGYAGTSSAAKVLMLHWNGKAWSRVTSPAVLTAAGKLTAVTVVSATSAWAVGYAGTITSSRTLLLHWNGTAWSQVTSPAPVAGALDAVTVSGSAGWATGRVPNGHNWPLPLFLRLSGGKWSRVAGPGAIEVFGVAVTGASAAWTVGDAEDHSVLGRWNGSTWAWLLPGSAPDLYYLGGIAAGPGGTAFAVGKALLGTAVSTVPVGLRLTGSTWARVAVSAPSNGQLNAVTFAPGGPAWAAGAAGLQTLLVRWTGSAWARVASPSPGGSNAINGVGFAAAGNGWAVGASDSKTLILHWNGAAWS